METENKVRKEYTIYKDNGKLGYVIEYPDKTIHHSTSITKLGHSIIKDALKNAGRTHFTIMFLMPE